MLETVPIAVATIYLQYSWRFSYRYIPLDEVGDMPKLTLEERSRGRAAVKYPLVQLMCAPVINRTMFCAWRPECPLWVKIGRE